MDKKDFDEQLAIIRELVDDVEIAFSGRVLQYKLLDGKKCDAVRLSEAIRKLFSEQFPSQMSAVSEPPNRFTQIELVYERPIDI